MQLPVAVACCVVPYYDVRTQFPPLSILSSKSTVLIPCRRSLVRCPLFIIPLQAAALDTSPDEALMSYVSAFLRRILPAGTRSRLFHLWRDLRRHVAAAAAASASTSASGALPSSDFARAVVATPAGAGGGSGSGSSDGGGEWVLDSRGVRVARLDVLRNELLLVTNCIAFSTLLARMGRWMATRGPPSCLSSPLLSSPLLSSPTP